VVEECRRRIVVPSPGGAKLKDARCFQAFGRFAAAAAVGLLGVTLLALARPVLDIHPVLLLGSVAVLAVPNCAACIRSF
jgi:hypothetical protein